MSSHSEKLLLAPPSATSAAAADQSISQSAQSIPPAAAAAAAHNNNEPLIDGQRFRANQLVMAIDLKEKIHNWYEAHIVEVCQATRRYLVHFKGFNKRYDQWKSFDDTTSLKNLPDNSIRFLKTKTSSLNSSSLSGVKKKSNPVPEEVAFSAPTLSLDVSAEDLLKSDKKLTRKRFTDSLNESSSPHKNKMPKKEPIEDNNSKISPSNIQKIMSRETSYNSTKIPDSRAISRSNKENNTFNDRKLQKKPKNDTKNSITPVDISEAKNSLSFRKNDPMSVANPVQNLKPLTSRSTLKNQSSSKIPHVPKNEKIDINEIKIDCVCQKTNALGFIIRCSNCNQWQHGNCIRLTEYNPPSIYMCFKCIIKPNSANFDLKDVLVATISPLKSSVDIENHASGEFTNLPPNNSNFFLIGHTIDTYRATLKKLALMLDSKDLKVDTMIDNLKKILQMLMDRKKNLKSFESTKQNIDDLIQKLAKNV